ncbi:MAG: M20/M25/M40 family metallo-hydrolase [Gemmatimonadetes bacterium]|nr:M20/M25/M40 family metallo-hydrolase [Gemmatimonadota bacterium]
MDLSVVQRIRDEGLNRSHVGELAGYLMDVIGPRLTGSTAMRRANDWVAEQFRGWGLGNVVVEPWGRFGRGWERVSFSARMIDPWVQPLIGSALAWSGSTRGLVAGPAVLVQIADTADFEKYHGRLRGAFILRAGPRALAPDTVAPWQRTSLTQLLDTTERRVPTPPTPEQQARSRVQQDLNRRIYEFLRREGATVLVTASRYNYMTLNPQAGEFSRAARDSESFDPLPAMQLSAEQYNLIARNLQRGVPVRLEANIQNHWATQDSLAYNTLAEIPGSDLQSQVVMIGAHLDSWFGATGATDNGAGSVVVMEAMRILKTLGLRPRRTIRVALWSGEEQGMLGARGWVRNHRRELADISAYLNIDTGTGRVRGIWSQNDPAVVPIFEQILSPFRDIGVVAVRRGFSGSTDHIAFDEAGVPGFDFDLDLMDYFTRTHHTNADTYDRLVIDDLEQAAVVAAYTAYHLAMRDEKMPRKPAATRGN